MLVNIQSEPACGQNPLQIAQKLSGSDISVRRRTKGRSQRELARRTGIHHRTVQYWEGKAQLDQNAYAVRRMEEALGW